MNSGLIQGIMLHDSKGHDCIAAEHDIIYAGHELGEYSSSEINLLCQWGWHYEEDYDCWGYST